MFQKAVEIIKNSEYLVALTGAGISAESGIPTFRGKDGLWKKFRAEELATPKAFYSNPKIVWEWYAWRMKIVFNAKPNPAHYALAKLEEKGILKFLITQNVDDLHEKAGSKKILHLHGCLRIIKCTKCTYKEYIKEEIRNIPPKCPKCNELMRPAVVWFGEEIPFLTEAYKEIEKCDVLLVIGTSGVVQPAALFPFIVKKNGGKVVEINLNDTPITSIADISIKGKASEILSKIVDAI